MGLKNIDINIFSLANEDMYDVMRCRWNGGEEDGDGYLFIYDKIFG